MTAISNEDYDWARDPDFRLLETCVACEEKKSMCDGGNPCRRCRFNKLECIYESSALLGKFEELQACVTALDAQLNDLLEETKILSEKKDSKMIVVKKEPAENSLQTPPASPLPDPLSRPKSKKLKSAVEPSGPVLSITQFTASRNPQSQAGMRLETSYTNFTNFSQLLELVKLVVSKESKENYNELLDDNYSCDMSCEIHREDSVFAMWTQPHTANLKVKVLFDKISWYEPAAINYILEWAYINDPQPYIDPIGFPEMRKNNIRDPPPEHSMLVYALAARYAHFAFSQNLDNMVRKLGPFYGEYFFGKAQEYESECFDSIEPEAVVAFAVMADYAFISLRDIKLTARYHFKAIRFALHLNFHQPEVNDPNLFTPEQQRRNSLIFEYLVINDATAWRGTTKVLYSGITQFNSKKLLKEMEDDELQTISENFYVYLRDIVEQYKSLSATVLETSVIVEAEALFLRHETNMHTLYKNLPDYMRAESGYPYKHRASFTIALRMSLHFHLLLLCSYRYIVMILRQIHTPEFLANAEKSVASSTEMIMRILDSYSRNDIPGVPYICGVAFAMVCDTLLTLLRSEIPLVRFSAELTLIRALETGRDWAERKIGWEDTVEFTRRLKKQLEVRGVTIPEKRVIFDDCILFNDSY